MAKSVEQTIPKAAKKTKETPEFAAQPVVLKTQPAATLGGRGEQGQDNTSQELVQLVVFSLDKEEYALQITDVREILEIPDITPIPNSPEYISGIINLRGRVIGVIDLERRFGLNRENKDIHPEHIIVIEAPKASFGVIVDEVTSVIRIPKGAIREAPDTVRNKMGSEYIQGVAVVQSKDQEDKGGTAEINKETSQMGPGSSRQGSSGQAEKKSSERILLLLDIKNILSEDEQEAMMGEHKGTDTDKVE